MHHPGRTPTDLRTTCSMVTRLPHGALRHLDLHQKLPHRSHICLSARRSLMLTAHWRCVRHIRYCALQAEVLPTLYAIDGYTNAIMGALVLSKENCGMRARRRPRQPGCNLFFSARDRGPHQQTGHALWLSTMNRPPQTDNEVQQWQDTET